MCVCVCVCVHECVHACVNACTTTCIQADEILPNVNVYFTLMMYMCVSISVFVCLNVYV